MSWDDFLAEFKARHPKDFGDSTASVDVKDPMVKEAVKQPVQPVSVPTNDVVEDVAECDGAELDDSDETDEYWK